MPSLSSAATLREHQRGVAVIVSQPADADDAVLHHPGAADDLFAAGLPSQALRLDVLMVVGAGGVDARDVDDTAQAGGGRLIDEILRPEEVHVIGAVVVSVIAALGDVRGSGPGHCRSHRQRGPGFSRAMPQEGCGEMPRRAVGGSVTVEETR